MLNYVNVRTYIHRPLITPHALKQELPATTQHLHFIQNSRQQIVHILEGRDPRLLLIVGPCSIHDSAAAKEYAIQLRQLSKTLSPHFFIVMRTYFEKPRTALGWKGLLYDPHLNGSHDIASGIRTARELLLFLAEHEIPTATEFLDPLTAHYLQDLVTWACIGARTVESQIHRQCASGLPMPVAFKNNTSGNIQAAVNGMLAASIPHSYLGIDDHGNIAVIETQGNPHVHVVLRGGKTGPNYDADSIAYTMQCLKNNSLQQSIIVDCSHGNSLRNNNQQAPVFESVIQQYLSGNAAIRGLILESNIHAGQQDLLKSYASLQYGVSITDPCMDWDTTKELLFQSTKVLERHQFSCSIT